SQEEEFENDNIRENTLGAAVGIDLNFGHFLVGLRANWDLQENNGEGESTTPRYKNQWFQGTLGYRF
ncbi:MAG: PorT family protein, partial [Flavobacteriaceae bacterium]|nr:PorT family protein [Flavobacteriaceae bacterium]